MKNGAFVSCMAFVFAALLAACTSDMGDELRRAAKSRTRAAIDAARNVDAAFAAELIIRFDSKKARDTGC